MPMPNRLLPSRMLADFLQRQGNFYQSLKHLLLILIWDVHEKMRRLVPSQISIHRSI